MIEKLFYGIHDLLSPPLTEAMEFTSKNLWPPILDEDNFTSEDVSFLHSLTNDDLRTFLYMKWVFNLTLILLTFLVVSFLTYGFYKLTATPYNRIKPLGSIGYQDHEGIGMRKKEIANMIRRRRAVGDNLPPVYPNGWFRLLDSWQLGAGEVKEVHAMGEHFAVFRGDSNETYVLDAYCPHMGGNLAIGGIVKGDCLQCPFHGWTFEGKDGKCTEIAYTEKIPERATAKKYASREVNGAIWVWYHCDGLEPQWEFPEIEAITSGQFTYKGRVEHHINTVVQDVPENGSDLAHLGFLHLSNVLAGNDLTEMYSSSWNFIKHIFKLDFLGPMKDANHISEFKLYHYCQLLSKYDFLRLDFNVYQIGPAIVHLHFKCLLGEGVFVQSLVPRGPLHLVLTHNLYATWRIPLWVARIMLYFEAIQVDRDVMIWNNKTFKAKPMLVKEDSLIAKYRRWFAQFYSENSPKLSMKVEDCSW